MALGGQRWSVVTTTRRQVRSGLRWALSECSLSLPRCISQLFPVLNSSWCSLLLLRSFPHTRLSPQTTTGGHVFVTACTSQQTPVFIVLCEGCAGGFPISTDLTLPWKRYFTFMWCTKSFGWVFRQTFLIIARCFWQSRCPSTDKHPKVHSRVQPWGLLEGSWGSVRRLCSEKPMSQRNPWEFYQQQGRYGRESLPTHT